MILFRLADQYAADNGITVDDAKVTQAFDTFQKTVGADTLNGQLTSNGVTLDDVRELVRLSLVQQQVATALAEKQFTDAQLQQQYQQSIGDYTTLHVDHILVDSKAKAEEVYKQVTAPGATLQDFQALAKKVSTDPSAKQNGGELTLPASQLVSEFSDAALKLKPGEISKPVHTQYGWHVIYMIDKQVTPFAQARDKIVSQASTKAFQDWVQSQAGEIQVDPSFGRFDPTTLQVERISSTDPSATQPPRGGEGLLDLVRVQARLRAPDGCPWDREQDHRTLARHLLEETHELLEAIDADDDGAIRDELGDLLLQVTFHAQIAADDGRWDVDDVADALVAKLVHRHPHVFGDVDVT